MKRLIHLTLAGLVIVFMVACGSSANHQQANETDGSHDGHHENAAKPTASTGNFGAVITADEAVPTAELPALLEGRETVEIKLVGTVESVCQMTGCWMDLDMGADETVHVTFADEAFLMPKDATGKTAVIEGVATFEEIPVDLLKHLAEDEGKSQEEIDAITEPKMEYTFVAKGVILKEGQF